MTFHPDPHDASPFALARPMLARTQVPPETMSAECADANVNLMGT